MFRVTFLGTSGSVPTVERGMPAIALKYESELMLWDCGEGTQRQLMKFKVGYGSVGSIFITHPHLDHYLGMFGLLEMGGMFTTVKVRDDLAAGDYRDPGWYKHPPGTVAWKASPEELKRLLG